MQEQRQDPLIEAALRWLTVLRDKAASDDDRQAFARWLKDDPRHEAAWRRAQQVWMRVGKIGPAFAQQAPAADASLPKPAPTPVLRPPETRPAMPRPAIPRPEARRSSTGRRRFFQATAAVAVVALAAGVPLSQLGLFADHRAGTGERLTVPLPDGSAVELAPASALSVDFAADRRRVVLLEGEAFFTVTPDPLRPFVVEAAGGRTRALATAFDVKLAGQSVTVTAIEHSVEIVVGGASQVVNEGQQVRYRDGTIDAVHDADLAQVDAWRHDRIVFQDAPLGEVIADLQRYRGGRIILSDSGLRTLRVTAAFDARQADAALDTIAAGLPIRVKRLGDLLVVLSPKA
jgi:transmembrane sensor